MTVIQIIQALSPSTTVGSRLDSIISLATQWTGTVFEDKRNEAIALLTLHRLALADNRGSGAASGGLRNEKEGDLERGYGVVTSKVLSDLEQTHWGMQLKELRNICIMSVRNRTI